MFRVKLEGGSDFDLPSWRHVNLRRTSQASPVQRCAVDRIMTKPFGLYVKHVFWARAVSWSYSGARPWRINHAFERDLCFFFFSNLVHHAIISHRSCGYSMSNVQCRVFSNGAGGERVRLTYNYRRSAEIYQERSAAWYLR